MSEEMAAQKTDHERNCQVVEFVNATCSETDSGGARCENTEPHTTEHFVTSHTIEHALAGNGYACSALPTASEERCRP